MKNVWTYRLAKISKYPRIRKQTPAKYKYIDTDGNKFTCTSHAKRFYKSKYEYKKRVNKPTIRILTR